MDPERYIPITIGPSGNWREGVDFTALRDDEEGFRVLVVDRSDRFPHPYIIRFPKPTAYRNCDEGKRLKSLCEQDLSVSSLFRVENSEFAAWLNVQSGYTGEMAFTTYAIATHNDWIEVISASPPEIVDAWET